MGKIWTVIGDRDCAHEFRPWTRLDVVKVVKGERRLFRGVRTQCVRCGAEPMKPIAAFKQALSE